jgi:peptidoglycan/LPS O-acetylase OafA/YrhL
MFVDGTSCEYRLEPQGGPEPSMTGSPERPATRLAGLDGLRGLAVLSVMTFHFGASWLPGGFFGVDIFYVLSGFLITSLLLQESTRTGRIRLKHFWARRARRLLPALLLVLLAVTWYVHFVASSASYPGYRADAFSTLFYFSNWHQIATSTNYFVFTGLASPLTHCWSLAIEEQFYLVWPLVTIAALWAGRRRGRGVVVLLGLCVVGATASAIEMASLFSPGTSTTRIYFGTDTHAQCLLVGAALACGLTLALRGGWSSIQSVTVPARVARMIDAGSLVGLIILVVLAHTLTGSSALTYEGGFLLVSLATSAMILAVLVAPRGLTAQLFAIRPLAWLGTISYGMYLWHYPLYLYLTPNRTGLSGVGLFFIRVMATIGIAALSFWLVERPIMRGTFWRSARALIPSGAGVLVVSGVIVAATVGTSATAANVTRYTAPAGTVNHLGSVVVLGDSMALTLYFALQATAPPGTRVTNASTFACGLVIATGISAYPPQPGLNMLAPCNSVTPANRQWPALDRKAVAHTAPGDIVLFMAGHDDTQGTLQHGVWTSILSTSFQDQELANLARLVRITTAHGAHLDLLTLPCTDIEYQYGLPMAPTDAPEYRDTYNRLLVQTAAAFPTTVSVIDYGSMLCPTGKFTEYLDGVQVRTPDGLHTPAIAPGTLLAGNATPAAASRFYSWLSPRIWPRIISTAG